MLAAYEVRLALGEVPPDPERLGRAHAAILESTEALFGAWDSVPERPAVPSREGELPVACARPAHPGLGAKTG